MAKGRRPGDRMGVYEDDVLPGGLRSSSLKEYLHCACSLYPDSSAT